MKLYKYIESVDLIIYLRYNIHKVFRVYTEEVTMFGLIDFPERISSKIGVDKKVKI